MKYLPEPFYIERTDRYRSSYSVSSTPYHSLDCNETIAKYGIQLPNNIIDRTCGISICPGCSARYAGDQYVCNRIVLFNRPNGAYHDVRGYSHVPNSKNLEKECGGYTKWDLSEQFETQKEFFSLIERIRCLPDPSHDPLIKFRDHFPMGVTDALKFRLLSKDIEDIKIELPAIKEGMRMIAEKMNNAGHALLFGF